MPLREFTKKMKPIWEECWKELMKWKDDDAHQLYYSEKYKSFDWIEGSEDSKPIDLDSAKLKMLKILTDQYNRYGRIIMYTCGDNSEVSFMDVTETTKDLGEQEDTLESLDFQPDFPLPFYIAKD